MRSSGASGHFRTSIYDPLLLFLQIGAVQTFFYSSVVLWTASLDLLVGTSRNLDQIFAYESLYSSHLGGRKLIVVYVLNALTAACGIWLVVKRAKLCLDFAFTLHFVHFVVSWAYNARFPLQLSWWLLQAVCVTLTTVLAEYLCLRSELKSIPLSQGPTADL